MRNERKDYSLEIPETLVSCRDYKVKAAVNSIVKISMLFD